MKEIKRFWINSGTYGVMDDSSTLVFLGELKEAEAECEKLNLEEEEYFRKIHKDYICNTYEVVKFTDGSCELFENLLH